MSRCDDLRAYVHDGQRCNLSAADVQAVAWATANNGSGSEDASTAAAAAPPQVGCVNWNQYYSSCRTVGNNPFLGAISFDNIGLAWVAIFQVELAVVSLVSRLSRGQSSKLFRDPTKFTVFLWRRFRKIITHC